MQLPGNPRATTTPRTINSHAYNNNYLPYLHLPIATPKQWPLTRPLRQLSPLSPPIRPTIFPSSIQLFLMTLRSPARRAHHRLHHPGNLLSNDDDCARAKPGNILELGEMGSRRETTKIARFSTASTVFIQGTLQEISGFI